MSKRFHGVLPAIVTPVDAKGRFDEVAYEKLVSFVYSEGVHGLYVCGQTGEGLQQDPAQRKRVAEASVRLSPKGKQVIVHVGAYNTATAIDLARHAERAGATAISSLAPSGPFSFPEVVRYYEAVAGATSLPLFVYHFPPGTAAIRTIEDLERLLQIPNVVGLKFTDTNLYIMGEVKRTGALIYNGADEMFSGGMLFGADGGIGSFYNIVPRMFVEMYESAQRGDWERARELQKPVNHLIRLALRYPGIAAVKSILEWMGLPCGGPIGPRRGLTAEEKAELWAALEDSAAKPVSQSKKRTPVKASAAR
ncbi:MAG: dihydrodipicolinate synthase family protein [Bryobacteraceae bacterium]